MAPVASVVLPLFAVILCGYIAGWWRLLGPQSSEALNAFVYWIALPALFLRGLNLAPLERILDGPLIAAYLAAAFALFALAFATARLVFGARVDAASLYAMTASFPNSGFMGVPLFVLAFGEEGSLVAIIATVAQTITVFPLAIVLVELGRGSGPLIARLLPVLRNIALNPLLIGALAGFALNVAGVRLAGPADVFVQTLAAAASPCALFALGLFLVGSPLLSGKRELSSLLFLKLLVHPALMWIVAAQLFALGPDVVRDVVLLAALPAGATVFVLAQNYRVFVERGSAAVLATTVVSLLTLSAVFLLYGV
jgi:predicted permease